VHPDAVNQPDFLAKITYRTTEQGGRRTPAASGYRPQVKFDFSEVQTSTSQLFRDQETVAPGETVVAEMCMMGKDYFAEKLSVGMRFEVREGARVTALGEILEIFNKSLAVEQRHPPAATSK